MTQLIPTTTIQVSRYDERNFLGDSQQTYSEFAMVVAHPIDGFAYTGSDSGSGGKATEKGRTTTHIADSGGAEPSTNAGPNASSSSDSSSSISGGDIAGIVIGALAALALLFAAFIFALRYHRKKRAAPYPGLQSHMVQNSGMMPELSNETGRNELAATGAIHEAKQDAQVMQGSSYAPRNTAYADNRAHEMP